ncbi:MAG: SIMPL domain-containing protein [Holosporales bacterium]|jgi:hypothetical protein|nr:SIMPL domain-containing protein [Holosporales bacterium]
MKRIISSIILGASIILGISISTKQTIKNGLMTSRMTIHGRAEEEVKADLIEWRFEYSTVGDDVENVKHSVKEAKTKIVEMLTSAGLEQDIDFEVLPKHLQHSKTDDGKNVFTISQNYEIRSAKLEAAEKAYKASAHLPEDGIAITTLRDATYHIKDAVSIERKLTPQAVQNAINCAEELAASQGCRIVGPPGIEYAGSVDCRDKGDTNYRSYGDAKRKDQIASITLQVSFTMLKND